MSTNINPNILKNFIVKTIGADKLAQNQAQSYGVDAEKFSDETVNKDNNLYLELDEILDDEDLYAHFATLYEEDVEQRENETNQEKEKEEAIKVKEKNSSGGA